MRPPRQRLRCRWSRFTSGERNSALGHNHYLCQAQPADRDG
jgi:hypothetical protein